MKLYKFFTIIILSVLISSSCNNPLDQDMVDAFSEDVIFKQMTTAEAYLIQCYHGIGGSAIGTEDVNNFKNVLGFRDDFLSTGTDECLNIHRAAEMKNVKGLLQPHEMGHYGNWRLSWINWRYLYHGIKNVNTFLEGVGSVPTATAAEEATKNRMIAEAHFIRAFMYTNLCRSYGGVILLDKRFLLDDEFTSYNRSSLEETVKFILADIDKAMAGLPDKNSVVQGRASKGTAAFLKTRLLSFVSGPLTNAGGYADNDELVAYQTGTREDRLKAAKEAAWELINPANNYGYALTGTTADPPSPMTEADIKAYADNFKSIFLQKGKWNDETFWGIQYDGNPNAGTRAYHNRNTAPNGWGCFGNQNPVEHSVRKFEMANGTPFNWSAWTGSDPNIRAYTNAQLAADPERNPWVNREPRFYATVLFDGGYWGRARSSTNDQAQVSFSIAAPGASLVGLSLSALNAQLETLSSLNTGGLDTPTGPEGGWNSSKTGYYLSKYLDPTLDGSLSAESNSNTWVEMRYSEVLLDYAEACIELGEIAEGLEYLNMVRNRAGLPDRVTSDQGQAREWLRNERLIEFYGEVDRWYTMRKWMLCGDVIETIHRTNVYHFNDGVHMIVHDTSITADLRQWNSPEDDRQYWLPISRDEMNKAPHLKQNPGYN